MKKMLAALSLLTILISASCTPTGMWKKQDDELYVQVGEEELYCINDPDYLGLYICEETKHLDLIENETVTDPSIFLEGLLRVISIFL